MIRTLILVVCGAALGAAATLLLVSQRAPRPAPTDSPLALFSPERNATPAAASAPPPGTGADFYRRLADADAAELARMAAEAAAAPPSTDRDVALAALLKRHAELDVVGAVCLARELDVRGPALATVYGAWARAAPPQVLIALNTIANPEDAADVALALVVALGNDARAVERVARVLGEREDEPLLRNGTVPVGPIIAPVTGSAVTGAAPRTPIALLAARWAELEPRYALGVAREVGDERVRMQLEAAALRALARIAPDDVFAEIANRGGSAPPGALSGAAVELARTDPERFLSMANRLPEDLRRLAEAVAAQTLADRDPLAALRYLEGMPGGVQRETLLRQIARSYGKRDPAGALEWARSQTGQRNLVAAVIGGVAEQDPLRAIDLALGLESAPERMQTIQLAVAFGSRTDAEAEALANRLLAIDDPDQRQSLATNAVSLWASRSPDGAMRWLLANGHNVRSDAFQVVGQALASRNPRDAVAYSAQVPPTARESWVNGVGQGYAQNDPQGAVEWLRQYRAEPWYGRVATTIATTVSQRDGPAAARLADELDAERDSADAQQLANIVAVNWANNDPAAAAAWALERRTEQERHMAVNGAVGVWSAQNFDAARQWTLRLPQGATRDAALTTLLTQSLNGGPSGLDTSLLNAFASEATKQAAVMQVVQILAFYDPAQARSFVDAYVVDPRFREHAERMIETARNNGGPRRPVLGSASGVRVAPPAMGVAPGMRVAPPTIVIENPE